ncbi:MAG TPA: hypothetical protein VF789_10245 [Thermoanaerobaculia bacterium]
MDIEETGWVILGTRFRCRGVPAADQADLAALLRGFPRAGAGEDAGGETVEIHAGEVEDGPAVPLSWRLEYRLVNEAIARAHDRWVLHAGAVEGPRGTCIVLGESGAGKTSLTLWLWSAGLRLVTDDLCPLAHGSLAPERFARALHMDCEYSPLLLARIPPRPDGYPADYYPFPGGAAGDPPPVADLLVIERGPEEISPLSQAEAAHRLLGAVIKSPDFEYGRSLADMIRLASRCRAHVLRSSTPESAGERALGLLAAD